MSRRSSDPRTAPRASRAALAMLALLLAVWPITSAAGQERPTTKTASCTLQVSGMTCSGCAVAVRNAAKQIDGVREATVSYERGTAEITYDPARTSPEAIAKEITEKTGFKASVSRRRGR